MRALFSNGNFSKALFWPNAVTPQPSIPSMRSIDFLWANRIIDGRHPIVLVEAVDNARFEESRTVILGFSADGPNPNEADVMNRASHQKHGRLDLLGWSEPEEIMKNSRYFVMFADRVFGNNALLEAMALGAIPIVNRSEGIDHLIDDGVNGFVVDLDDLEATSEVLLHCFEMDFNAWVTMSQAAREAIRTRFSSSDWAYKTDAFYRAMSL